MLHDIIGVLGLLVIGACFTFGYLRRVPTQVDEELPHGEYDANYWGIALAAGGAVLGLNATLRVDPGWLQASCVGTILFAVALTAYVHSPRRGPERLPALEDLRIAA